MLQNYAANLHKGVSAGVFSCMLLPLHYWLCCFVFTYLTAKDYYSLFEFLNDTLLHNATRSINIGTFKMLKQSFKIFKPYVLKATSFRRWNETVFQKFCDTYYLSKFFFKNMSVLTRFELCAILSFVADVIGTW